MVLLFWISVTFIFYTYASYPLWLVLLGKIHRKPVRKSSYLPRVSIVIAACNEESNIVRRVMNIREQNYPAEKLDIVIVSDGSTDRTVELVQPLEDERLTLVKMPGNYGKAVALNTGMIYAQGDIVVFTDARQTFAPDAIRQLVANFADPSVGCVSGELVFVEGGESRIEKEMGAYWKYEKWIRKMESCTGSVVGATGAIYAIRQALYRPLPSGTLLDDVLTPLNVVRQGYRCIFDGTAVAYDQVSKDLSHEWRRKVRTLAGNWQLLGLLPVLAFPFLNPVWWRFMSHKIFRLLVPIAIMTLLVSVTQEGLFYRFCATAQVFLFMGAMAGHFKPSLRKFRLINLLYFFAVLNLAALAGFWRWVTGECQSSWLPAYASRGSES